MEDIEPEPQQQLVPQERERRELTALETRQVVCELLRSLKDPNDLNKLRRGALTDIAKMFHVHPRTISRVWARAIENYENPHVKTFRGGLARTKLVGDASGSQRRSEKLSNNFPFIDVEAFVVSVEP